MPCHKFGGPFILSQHIYINEIYVNMLRYINIYRVRQINEIYINMLRYINIYRVRIKHGASFMIH